jgi:hypothetical protein
MSGMLLSKVNCMQEAASVRSACDGALNDLGRICYLQVSPIAGMPELFGVD